TGQPPGPLFTDIFSKVAWNSRARWDREGREAFHDGAVLVGPRCLDLRRDTILHHLPDAQVQAAPTRDPLRLTLDQAPAEPPRTAAVMLRWGPGVAIAETPPLERLRPLLPNRMYRDRLTGNPEALLTLTAAPLFTLARPRGQAGLQGGRRRSSL